MSQEKYVAYVSTYTVGKVDKYGIRIYDVDLENGRLTEKNQVRITKQYQRYARVLSFYRL